VAHLLRLHHLLHHLLMHLEGLMPCLVVSLLLRLLHHIHLWGRSGSSSSSTSLSGSFWPWSYSLWYKWCFPSYFIWNHHTQLYISNLSYALATWKFSIGGSQPSWDGWWWSAATSSPGSFMDAWWQRGRRMD
jgi:hypothetical protein